MFMVCFIRNSRSDVCKCGYSKTDHSDDAIKPEDFAGESWNIHKHVRKAPTDAFGDISFGSLGHRTGKVRRFLLSVVMSLCANANLQVLVLSFEAVFMCALPVCSRVRRHPLGGPVPLTDRPVETVSSQSTDLSDRRSQEFLSEGPPEEHVPPRSYQSGSDNR